MDARHQRRFAALLISLVVVPLTAAPASAEQLTKYDAGGVPWSSSAPASGSGSG